MLFINNLITQTAMTEYGAVSAVNLTIVKLVESDNNQIINEINLPVDYLYFSIPKVNNVTYLMARVTDYGKYNLLPGKATVNFENTFVGTTYVNPETIGDSLNLNMGEDKRINIKRELVTEKSGTRFLSSTKEQTFTYEITIKNNKKESVNLMLEDQVPVSVDESLKVELEDNGGTRASKENGFLIWDLKLNAGENRKIRFSYKIKSDKNKTIEHR